MSNPSDKIIIIAAPSGAGKTSIVRFLLNRFESQLGFSISCATRSPRLMKKRELITILSVRKASNKKLAKINLRSGKWCTKGNITEPYEVS